MASNRVKTNAVAIPSADPTQKEKVPLISTLGSTGLKQYSGYVFEDFLPQLRGREACRVYGEMANNDPILGAIIFACAMLIRQADWRVEPSDDSDQADQAKQYMEEVMEDMDHSWVEFIEECVTFLTYGFSLFEIVYKIRGGPDTTDITQKSKFTDKRFGVRKLSPRSQDSVLRWLFDPETGDLQGVEQLTETGYHALIPIQKTLVFRTESKKENPEGRSILRNCYVSYTRKKAIEDAEGRAALRSAGIVQLKIPGRIMSPEADANEQAVYNTFKTLATTLSKDQQGAIILPSDRDGSGNPLYEMQYVVGDGRRPTDFSQIIKRFDEAMATSVLADFVLLGQSGAGSYALSSNKSDIFSQALNSYITSIAGVINRHLIPRLWQLNNFDPEVMPEVKAEPVEVPDLQALAAYITALAGAGARLFPDEGLEEHLREIADMPPVADTAKAGTPQVQMQAQAAEEQAQAQAQHPNQPNQPQNQQPNQPPVKKSEDEPEELSVEVDISPIMKQLDELRRVVSDLAKREPPPPPTITLTPNITFPTITMPKIENIISPPQVTVTAPNVTVEKEPPKPIPTWTAHTKDNGDIEFIPQKETD